jgi:hypothetical protein
VCVRVSVQCVWVYVFEHHTPQPLQVAHKSTGGYGELCATLWGPKGRKLVSLFMFLFG